MGGHCSVCKKPCKREIHKRDHQGNWQCKGSTWMKSKSMRQILSDVRAKCSEIPRAMPSRRDEVKQVLYDTGNTLLAKFRLSQKQISERKRILQKLVLGRR